jgi:hypothetical protein
MLVKEFLRINYFFSKERLKGGEEIILEGSGKKRFAAEPYRVNWI